MESIKIGRTLKTITVKEFIDDFVYRIDLDADYQRENIWTVKDQQRLIDSIIKDIDIPKMYLAEVENNGQFDYECVDGKQRILALLKFFKSESDETPLTVELLGKVYTYEKLKKEHPTIVTKIENYELHIIIYRNITDNLVRLIFQRLQLGRVLNSGEMLKSYTGTIRDFIFKDVGKACPFLAKTSLSEKRFSKEFTLAQICINSFSKKDTETFTRARLEDLEDFFEDKHDLSKSDENIKRIKDVLTLMDETFGESAKSISSRAVAVSAYLFCEELFKNKQENEISVFSKFYEKLLNIIKSNMEQVRNYKPPSNRFVLNEFQDYITKASVEANSIKRRHEFLIKTFDEFQKTGKIIGS